MGKRDDVRGDFFAGLKPIYTSRLVAARKIDGDVHLIFVAKQVTPSGIITEQPVLYQVIPISNRRQGQLIIDNALKVPLSEEEIAALSAQNRMQ